MNEGIHVFDPLLSNQNPCVFSCNHRSEATKEVTVHEAIVEDDLVKLQFEEKIGRLVEDSVDDVDI